MKSLLIVSLLFGPLMVAAQDIKKDKITWKVNQGNDIAAKKNFNYNCIFKTDGEGTLVWQQKNGTYTTEFSIVSIEGTWIDVTKTGQVIYNLVNEGGDASIVFERTGSGTSATLTIFPEGRKYIFKVNDVIIEK
jgi:hypothetical protein